MPRTFALIIMAGLFSSLLRAADSKSPPTPPEGMLPLGADGKALNLDFETGTLKDWTVEGDAFKGQPINGDTISGRRGDSKSQHQGDYWIGGYELHGDKPQGTLTSKPFKVTQPWASFLVAGGSSPDTCVELVRKDTGEIFSRTSGLDEENLRPVSVDLRPLQGKEIFIRLVDHSSNGWGHLNFDNFRFHSEKPNAPARNHEPPPADQVKYSGLEPDKAAQAMTVPEGFHVSLFAGEPDVCQPIAMCLDERGRLWVAEAYSYPVRRPDKEAKDRIVIFEDTKGTGKFDKRTVFLEGLNLISGLEVGFGGVWIGASPYLMFVPKKEGEDKPAGEPKILLDGWHYEDTHETLNAFCWGPDGWLYGCHGVFTHSRVGKPGTPDKDRTPINAGVWRYHPTRHTFEVFANGTSNPWGVDFDEHGQCFIEACVVPHAFHMIQGGRYLRQGGVHFNPHTYADIQTIADHLHWQGADPWAGNNRSDSTGGGHAHCGLMIYQGAAWPDEYRGKMFMGNVHGHRFNMDILKPNGSGFIASHGPDFLLANDAWARFINLRYGPDGNVFFIDWYDKQACHHGDVNIWDRSNGRVYKVSYRGTKPVTVDLVKKSDQELVDLQLDKNDWYVRTSRRLLQERAVNKKLDPGAIASLITIATNHKDETRRLRALWALHVTAALNEELIAKALTDPAPYVRAWAIQLATEVTKPSDQLLKTWAEMAKKDSSPVVRLYLASALDRLLLANRWDIMTALVSHSEDATDPNLPLMYWYAAEPLAAIAPSRALELAGNSKIPILRPFMVRRISSSATPEALSLLVKALAQETEAGRQIEFLNGLNEGLKGRRQVAMPKAWPDVYAKLAGSKDGALRSQARALAVTFGDPTAFAELRKVLISSDADVTLKQGALDSLLGAKDKDLPPLLHRLVKDPGLRSAAIRGLASYNAAETPDVLVAAYPTLNGSEKRDALNTLSSRVPYGKALMEAIADKKIPANEVPAEVVRQLRGFQNKDLEKRIGEVWGLIRTTPADRAKLIAEWRKKLATSSSSSDLSLGRAVFAKTCQQCHMLYGVGGKVGPDITGSNRPNLDYLLENILDPSAVIPNDYRATLIELKNGRVVTGIIRGETAAALTVVTANETITIPTNEVETRTISDTSMMPDDVLKTNTEEEVRALIAYLRNPNQVPMLATVENVKDFFNGKDLAGWDGDPKLWSVVDGEIVGKSPGIKRNEFLKSHLSASDFRLTLKIKLTPNKENSGVQFRSEPLPDGEMKGPQADVGLGWWGKLYEESGRGILSDNKSGEQVVKIDGWNEYEIIADGSHVKTFINGKSCVDLKDPNLSRRGIFGLQIHAGGTMEVRFKDLKLELLNVPKGQAMK